MIYINNDLNSKINNWNKNNIYIVTDFDRTITRGDSESQWGIIAKSGAFPEEYIEERQRLYNIYRPIEIDLNIPDKEKCNRMTEWFQKHIALFIKYKLSEDTIKGLAQNINIMKFRDGARELLERLYKDNIPVIIISAGIGNFIEMFLKFHNCYYSNIYIISNFIKFENGIAVGISDKIIHSLNKNVVSLSNEEQEIVKDRENIILMGDCISDIRMVSQDKLDNTITIGFLETEIDTNLEAFKENFDIVAIQDTSFDELTEILKI